MCFRLVFSFLKIAFIEHSVIQLSLAERHFQNVLIDAAVEHQPMHCDLFFLAQSMTTIFRLPLDRRIERTIEEYYIRRRRQIDTETAGARR